jgi:uncharacterized protein (DUF433 family)
MTKRDELLERISIDPMVCFGKPCVLDAYPQLKTEDIRASLAFAAEMTRERIIPIPVESASP